jgi:hypothetical protein
MQLRAPANRTYPVVASRVPASHDSLWALVYVALVVSLVVASVAVFATRSDAFNAANASSQATSSFVPAHNVHGLNSIRVVRAGGYELQIQSVPRQMGQAAIASVRLLQGVHTVDGARVRLTFSMPDMPEMRGLSTLLRQIAPGVYAHASPILTVGSWLATVQVTPPHSAGFIASFTYRISI